MISYTIQETAKILNCAPKTVRSEIDKKTLIAFKVGSDFRISDYELNRYMKRPTDNFKTIREIELEKENNNLRKELRVKNDFIDRIKNDLLRIS